MRYFALLFFSIIGTVCPQSSRAQLFVGLELGTELHNDFQDFNHGITQPYWMSARFNAGVIVNRWRFGVSESFSYTNPNGTHLEGGFAQYGLDLIEIDGSKLIDLYLGVELYTQLFQHDDTYLPIGILASTTLPSIVDLSIRTGYDFHQDRYYIGLSLGRNISKHTRPAGEKIPYPDDFTPCEYAVFNQTQVPIQTLFHVGERNPEDVIADRFKDLRIFTRVQNENTFVSQPSLEGALTYMDVMGLSELANAIRLGVERADVHRACQEEELSTSSLLRVLWRRLSDTYMLIRDAKR